MKHVRLPIVALVGAALLSVAAGVRPSATGPGLVPGGGSAVDVGAPVATGTASGTWNLPTPSEAEDGYAFGVLELAGGFPFYLMSAVLPAGSVSGTGSGSEGALHGVLQSFPLSPIGDPIFLVHGQWTATGPEGGTFSAWITTGGGPMGVPTFLVGTISGTFSDHTFSGGPEVLGSFEAAWDQLPFPSR